MVECVRMLGDPESVKDLLDGTRRDRKKAEGTSSKHVISAIINQIKAIGRSIETTEKLDRQNRRLEKAALFVGLAGVLAVIIQIFSLFHLQPIQLIFLSAIVILTVVLAMQKWLKQG